MQRGPTQRSEAPDAIAGGYARLPMWPGRNARENSTRYDNTAHQSRMRASALAEISTSGRTRTDNRRK